MYNREESGSREVCGRDDVHTRKKESQQLRRRVRTTRVTMYTGAHAKERERKCGEEKRRLRYK